MIENLIMYALIMCVIPFIIRREHKETNLEIKRKSDAVIEVIAGRYILKEK